MSIAVVIYGLALVLLFGLGMGVAFRGIIRKNEWYFVSGAVITVTSVISLCIIIVGVL